MSTGPKTKKMIKHPDWEIYMPMKVTWVGFLLAWLIVIATIFGTVLLSKIGA